MEQKNIYQKLIAIQKDLPAAKKNAANPYFNSRYADINELYEIVKPRLHKHNLLLQHVGEMNSGTFEMHNGIYGIRTIIVDVDTKEQVSCFVRVVIKEDDPQKQGSSITYARRYGLSALLAIETEDDDGNAASGKEKDKSKQSLITERASKHIESSKTEEELRKVDSVLDKLPKELREKYNEKLSMLQQDNG